jgi:amidase
MVMNKDDSVRKPGQAYSNHSLVTSSACEALTLLQNRKISAIELLEEHISRVERLNPKLNIVVSDCFDQARHVAKDCDSLRAKGRPLGPLSGLPMTIKDSFEVAGMPATCGLPSMAKHIPTRDAHSVSLLRQAGAIIYGKTNVPAGCGDHQTYNSIYGTTNNPWDVTRTPGGSSGGSAAALAAGMTMLELGSDIGGSIRCPAHFCGVFGHKTSHGLISADGHIPPPPSLWEPSELSVVGPLARSPYDLSLMLDVLLAGQNTAVSSMALEAARHERLDQYRVGVWLDAYSLDDDYKESILAFTSDLEKAGVKVSYHADPKIDPYMASDTYLETLFGVIGSRMPDSALNLFRKTVTEAGDKPYAKELDTYITGQGHLSAAVKQRRQQLMSQWETFFEGVDILICPVVPTVAFSHDQLGEGPASQLNRVIEVSGKSSAYLNNLLWPGLVSVANLPATAIPTGYFVDGVPAGIQAIGPAKGDRTTLRFAELVSDHVLGQLKFPVY